MTAAFVLAARAHGIGPTRILVRYVVPAALNPLISLLGLTIGNLLGASFLIEVVMSWPGLGPLFLDAIFARDMYLVIGTVFFSATFFIVGNLVADVPLVAVDANSERALMRENRPFLAAAIFLGTVRELFV